MLLALIAWHVLGIIDAYVPACLPCNEPDFVSTPRISWQHVGQISDTRVHVCQYDRLFTMILCLIVRHRTKLKR